MSNMKENKRMIEIDIGPVLKRIRYERGLTLQKLSRLTDDKVLPSNISRIESAGAGATLKTLTTLANALGTSPSDILREAEGGDKVITKPQQVLYVPVLSWVQAGTWTESPEQPADGDYDEWVEAPRGASRKAFGLRVQGDSMQAPIGKSFPEGCCIVVDPTKQADNRSFVVARLADTGEHTFKQLIIDGPHQYLKPLNPSYRTIEVNSEVHVCGVVLAWGEGYTVNGI
ncbi:helix-turn-helix domain-containing protein [Parasutterella excrementihominis]|nr:helix-turn-helix domain-containing protein [Vibrio parahaemolyticus]MTU02732.1 helix-turn-helix domain-containing protein [Parasutterella excrementihominis]EGQ9405910.1 helix-turn-helix domain-containing protein [Vibrio parahaemolyticus]EGR0448380.1 helix-turn-helix domain-containing protein [Vibrio parahaemolyticus]EGR0457029.1 helix-turn-helix domain-containing protein [Vibrio parahaemolyticus]